MYRKIQGVTAEKVGAAEEDDLVVYDANTELVHILNSTAAEIFELIDQESKTIDEIITCLLDKYDVTSDEIRNDVQEILDELVNKGIIGHQNAEEAVNSQV